MWLKCVYSKHAIFNFTKNLNEEFVDNSLSVSSTRTEHSYKYVLHISMIDKITAIKNHNK